MYDMILGVLKPMNYLMRIVSIVVSKTIKTIKKRDGRNNASKYKV